MTTGRHCSTLTTRIRLNADRRVWGVKAGCWLLAVSGIIPSAIYAAEYHRDEDIAPESAEDVHSPMRDSTRSGPAPLRRILGKRLENASPFWRDTEARLRFRLYDFERENGDSTLSEAVAGGAEWEFSTGRWKDHISMSASWYTSFEIDAPEDREGTALLGPDQSDLSVLGKAYMEINFDTFIARLYRQDFDLPYLNRQDSRMIPNTHEGYIVGRIAPKLSFSVGYITKMKRRDDEDFVAMAEVAGVDGDDSGTQVAGFKYGFNENLYLGGFALRTPDVFQTTYAEAGWSRSLNERWGFQLSFQATDQRGIGDEQLGEFQTANIGLRTALSYRHAVLTVAYSSTDDDARIRAPYGGTPSFTSLMLFDFDRAGENAWSVGLSQNFKRFGYPGIGLQINYGRGQHARNADDTRLHDQREIDFTADFRPAKGLLKGLWLRLRYARGDRGPSADDRRDFRVILNYEIRL